MHALEEPPQVDDQRLLPLPTSRSALAIHTALLATVLLAILAFVNNGQVGFPDEGIYSAQVDNLSRGSWSAPIPAKDIDPDGRHIAAVGSAIVGDSFIPYSRQALYPLVLLPAFELGGVAGMLVVSTFGTVVAALAAALLARRIDPSLGIAALWLAGIGSPLLFDAYFIVGHSLAAALAGMLAVALCAVLDDRRTVWLWAVVPLAIALTLIRSEGLLVVLGLGIVAGLAAFSRRPRPAIEWRTAMIGAALVFSGAATYLINLRITAAIVGTGAGGALIADRDSDALSSAWVSLLRPWDVDNRLASPQATLMTAGTVLAIVTYRLLPRFRVLSMGLLLMAAGAAVVLAAGDPDLISGLLPVFPAAVVGIGLLERLDFRQPVVLRVLATSALVAAGILATTYGSGGGVEWGGRFFHVLIPFLVAPAVLGISHARTSLPAMQYRVAGVALLVMVVALGSVAVRTNRESRVFARTIVDGTMTFVEERGGKPTPALAVAPLGASGAGRLFWMQLGEGQEVIAPISIGAMHGVIRDAAASGRDRIALSTDIEVSLVEDVLGSTLDDTGWTVLDHAPAGSYVALLMGPESNLRG
jgi:hypothetical protein